MNPVQPVTSTLTRRDTKMMSLALSLVVPVFHEQENITRALELLAREVHVDHEVVIIYDDDSDPTVPIARECAARDARVRVVKNVHGAGRGLLNAIRTGIDVAQGDAVIVTMADVTDDVTVIDQMVRLHRQGHAIVAPSRHMRGGSKTGGPRLKSLLSRYGGVTLQVLSGLPTSDPTNAFKLFDSEFLRRTPIESVGGFEYSLELCAKAYWAGESIAEFPTRWHERTAGTSKFKLWKWLPLYLRWYWWLLVRVWRRRL